MTTSSLERWSGISKVLRSSLGWVVLALVVVPVLGAIVADLVLGQGDALTGGLRWVQQHAVAVVITAVAVAAVWGVLGLIVQRLDGQIADRRQEEQRLREHEEKRKLLFDLCKPASDLQPEDLRFSDDASADKFRTRPYPAYLPRRIAAYDKVKKFSGNTYRDGESDHDLLTEEDLARSLAEENKSFVLVGPPGSGKTRTVLDVLHRLETHMVLAPRFDLPDFTEEDLQLFTSGKHVLILLNDLSNFRTSGDKLRSLCTYAERSAASLAVVATCRDGAEWRAVHGAVAPGQSGLSLSKSTLARFIEEDYRLKEYGLLPQTLEEKRKLASNVGASVEDANLEQAPTPGAIAMAEMMEIMRRRFERLSRETQDVLSAMLLLQSGGIAPLKKKAVRQVFEDVFDRQQVHFDDQLRELHEHSFILGAAMKDPIEPEFAYLTNAVSFTKDKPLEEYTGELTEALYRAEDPEALFTLGTTLQKREDWALSLRALKLAEELDPGNAMYARILSVMWDHYGKPYIALKTAERAVQLEPENLQCWTVKGFLLKKHNKTDKARRAFEKAAGLYGTDNQDERAGLHNDAGFALFELERYEEALAAYNEAIKREHFSAIFYGNRANALFKLDRSEEAFDDLAVATALNPYDAVNYFNKGVALWQCERYEEALDSYDDAIERDSDDAIYYSYKGAALVELRRYEEASDIFDEAIARNPNDTRNHFGKALALFRLDRFDEVFTTFDKAISRNPESADLYLQYGNFLEKAGLPNKAAEAYRHALTLENIPSRIRQQLKEALERLREE